jgi:hypothetical protein
MNDVSEVDVETNKIDPTSARNEDTSTRGRSSERLAHTTRYHQVGPSQNTRKTMKSTRSRYFE